MQAETVLPPNHCRVERLSVGGSWISHGGGLQKNRSKKNNKTPFLTPSPHPHPLPSHPPSSPHPPSDFHDAPLPPPPPPIPPPGHHQNRQQDDGGWLRKKKKKTKNTLPVTSRAVVRVQWPVDWKSWIPGNRCFQRYISYACISDDERMRCSDRNSAIDGVRDLRPLAVWLSAIDGVRDLRPLAVTWTADVISFCARSSFSPTITTEIHDPICVHPTNNRMFDIVFYRIRLDLFWAQPGDKQLTQMFSP